MLVVGPHCVGSGSFSSGRAFGRSCSSDDEPSSLKARPFITHIDMVCGLPGSRRPGVAVVGGGGGGAQMLLEVRAPRLTLRWPLELRNFL